MQRSTLAARLITIAVAIVLTPVALTLLSAGGQIVNVVFFSFGRPDLGALGGPLLLQALGVVLLILVLLSGVWSSAGLLAAGVLSVAPLVFALFPSILFALYRVVPREWVDGLVYGVPLLVLPVLGAMGLVLFLVRRRARVGGTALSVVGLLAAPLLLAAAAWSISWGIAEGTLRAMQQLDLEFRPAPALAVLGGVVLLVAGVLVSRWSPFALLVPAVVLLASSVLLISAPEVFFPALRDLPRGINTVLPTLLLFGAGATTALLYLAFTAVLLRVRSRAAAVEAAPAEGRTAGAAYPPPPPAYPAAPPAYPAPGQAPPAPGQAYPPAPPAYPAPGSIPPPPPAAAQPPRTEA